MDGGLEVLGDPASGQNLEPDLAGDLFNDLDGNRSGVSDPVGVVSAVGEVELDEGEGLREAFSGGMTPSRSWTSAGWAWTTSARPSVSTMT